MRLGQGRLVKTGATVLWSGRLLTTAETGLEGPERMLTTGATAFEWAMKAANNRSNGAGEGGGGQRSC